MTSVTIPNSVTSIRDYAFYGCKKITNVIIPNGVTSIGNYAFLACTGLASITIPNSVTSIAEGAFKSCSGLTDVYYTGTQSDWNNISIDDENTYLKNATLTYIAGTKTTVSGKIFTVSPINTATGNTVVVALYDGNKLVETQSAVYSGEDVEFTTEEDYTKAKVFVWKDTTTAVPVCEAEIVK